jgi:O-antigen/teichoic acid export membrane protein
MAQHIAYTVLNDTDTIVLTMLGSLTDVSIYGAYNMVVYGVKRLFTSMMNGVEAYLGTLWAKEDEPGLQRAFAMTEWTIHTTVVFTFGCTGFLIVPFIQCYTKGITDANYIQPLFAALIVMAHACHCLRLPYNLMIFAAGKYKETQHNYVIATVMNIVISVLCVKQWGLVGVAIGTLVSMLYQTIWMARYNAFNLVRRPMTVFGKQILADLITVSLYAVIPLPRLLTHVQYSAWILLAVETVACFGVITLVINLLLYKTQLNQAFDLLRKRTSKS